LLENVRKEGQTLEQQNNGRSFDIPLRDTAFITLLYG